MQDVTSHRSLWFYLFTISWAKRLGNQVMMYGCGIGPIHSPANRRRASRVLQKSVDAITLRDTHSRAELADMVGYNDSHYFTVKFKKVVGCTPSEYGKRKREQAAAQFNPGSPANGTTPEKAAGPLDPE